MAVLCLRKLKKLTWADMSDIYTLRLAIEVLQFNRFIYTGAPNESVPHITCSPEESCWLAKIQVFR